MGWMTIITNQAASRQRGNALMEYALPAGVILLSAGLLVTVSDATGIMAEYYLSASGRTKASLQGRTFKTQGLADGAYGDASNGFAAFAGFAGLKDGAGGAVASAGGGLFYAGDASRKGGRRPSPSPDALYP